MEGGHPGTPGAVILRYGDPFDQITEALLAVSSSKQGETVLLDEHKVDRLIGDRRRHIPHEEYGLAVQARLDDLLRCGPRQRPSPAAVWN